MARYRGGDGHYADVECANAELERYLVLSFNEEACYWEEEGHQSGGLSYSRHAENHRALFTKDAAHNLIVGSRPIVGSRSRALI
jgi:hypothetical protein